MSESSSRVRLVLAAGVLVLMASNYGTSLAPKTLTAVAGLLVLLPWVVTRQSLTLQPLILLGALLGLIGVLGGGGNIRLALMSFAALLPAGLIVGECLAGSVPTRIVVSVAIAVTQWSLIVNQYRNPFLVLERLSAHSTSASVETTPLSQLEGLRPVGTTVSPGLVAFILVTAIALSTTRGRADRWQQVTIWGLAAGHAFCLLLTGSRTGIAAAAILMAWQARSVEKFRSALRVGTLLGGGLMVIALSESSGRVATGSRLDIIRAATPTLREHWLFGVGWGNTPRHVSTTTDGIVYHLHALPLHVLFELGLCGAVALFVLSLQLGRRSMLAVLVLVPFAMADAGVFINATTVFFVGILIETACQKSSPVANTRRAFATL